MKTPPILLLLFLSLASTLQAQPRRPPAGGQIAVVVDERLSALRTQPGFFNRFVQRVRRGRLIAVTGNKRTIGDVVFYRVRVTRRTQGWMQREAFVLSTRPCDDRVLLELILLSDDFDRVSRARIFLETFPRSSLRPQVLSLLAQASESVAIKLSHDAQRRFQSRELPQSVPESSYFLNYSGLDRYQRLRVSFIFDNRTRQFHYDGAAWLEILKRYPESDEAVLARKRLERLRFVRSR